MPGSSSRSVSPANTVAPTVSGTPAVGQVLTCSTGTWTGAPPLSYTYQWLRDGTPIAAVTNATYTITAADQGHELSCQVAASNLVGSSQATSSAVSVPAPDTSAPSISITTPSKGATYSQGQVVNASYACTDPDGPADVASCVGPVASGSPIDTPTPGSHSFTVNAADQAGNAASQTVTYTVTSAGGGGSSGGGSGGGGSGGGGSGGGRGASTPAVTTSGAVSTTAQGTSIVVGPGMTVSCPAGGHACTADLTATAKVRASGHHANAKLVVVARAQFTIASGQATKLKFKLNGKGARLLRRLGHLRITVTVISRVADNTPITTTKTTTIRAPKRRHRRGR